MKKMHCIDFYRKLKLWINLGGIDIASRYRRSTLGASWIVIVNSLTIFAIGLVYSSIFGMKLENYFPFLVIGYILWLWISSTIIEITNSLIAYRYILINNEVDPVLVFTRVFSRNILIFLHNIPILIVIFLLYGLNYKLGVLIAAPNFLLVAAILFSGSGSLAFYAAKYQDAQHLITASIGVLFLVTPIIWSVDILKERAYIGQINPLTHMIEIIRAPLLGYTPTFTNYAVCGVSFVVCANVFLIAYRQCNHKYIFWI